MRSKPKKRLGQNFLADKNILRKIINAVDLKDNDIIVEIGAGNGELTELIAKNVNKIYAFEIDKDLCCILKDKFKACSNVEIINQDILKAKLNDLGAGKKIKVLGNIPYYISSPIIEHLLNFKDNIGAVFITVQKEFARRIISGSGSKAYGSLSCFVQYYTIPQAVFYISKNCFWPIPKVDSCLLKLEIRDAPAVKVKNEERFFRVIRTAFNQRRKTLRNSLKNIIPQKSLESFFEKYKVNRNIRPECFNLENFAELSDMEF